jgi:hypothetical protein
LLVCRGGLAKPAGRMIAVRAGTEIFVVWTWWKFFQYVKLRNEFR